MTFSSPRSTDVPALALVLALVPAPAPVPGLAKKKASLAVRKERQVLRFWKSICRMGLKRYQFLTVCLAGERYRCEVAEIEDYKVFLFVEGRSYHSMADVGYYSLKNIKKMVV